MKEPCVGSEVAVLGDYVYRADRDRVRPIYGSWCTEVEIRSSRACHGERAPLDMVQLEIGFSTVARSVVMVGTLGCFFASTSAHGGWSEHSKKGDTFVAEIDDILFTLWY